MAGATAAALAASLVSIPAALAAGNEPAEPTPYAAPTGNAALTARQTLELETEAEKALSPGAFAYIAHGVEKQWTIRENIAAFDRIALLPKYLTNPPKPDLTTRLLGHTLSMPIITTPMGAQGLAHKTAELGTAKGTADAGTLMTVSTAANTLIEDIAAASDGPKWFQIYLLEDDRPGSANLLKRAEAAGYSAVVFTIDAFAPGVSDAAVKLGFSFPPSLAMVNSGTPIFKKSLGWDDVKFIRDNTGLPLIIKGLLTPDIAERALKEGAAALQVSNHGGRQLDGVPSPVTVLPQIAETVGNAVPIIMDSGIRRGSDVFKALALGASAVAIGRPVLYGLALGGAAGVTSVYGRIKSELERTMTIAGAPTVGAVNNDFLA